MASKKELTPEKQVASGYIDLTKTGPLSYRLLRSLNNNLPEESSANQALDFSGAAGFRTPGVYYTELPNDFGESMFDQELASQAEFSNYLDLRAENQPWYAKIGAGLAKGTILAGTTFLDGTIGLVVGGATAINEGRWSGLWDNDFSKAMQSVNQWSEEALPNYYTEAEQTEPWYENIFTANFLGDKFLKNLGFSVGAIYSGGVWGSVLKATKLPLLIGIVANSSKAPAIVTSGVGATLSAVNEGRIEALNNSTEWYETLKSLLELAYKDRLTPILEWYENNRGRHLITDREGNYIDPVALKFELTIAKELENYQLALAKLNEDRAKMGNVDLLLNIPILTASNIILFGKYYANGFKTARKATNIVGTAGEYVAEKSTAKGVLAVTKGALSEGVEEISQKAASRIPELYYSLDVTNFYKSKIDPKAELETLSWIKSTANGITSTLGESGSWEEFFIGTLTGALGIPKFKGMKNAQGQFQMPIGIEGGAYNEFREYQEKMTRENEIATYLNNRVQSPDFLNYYQGLIRHNKYQNDMNQAVVDNNEFDFKNAEYALFVSDISMFDNAGKIEDLTTLINSAFDTSDENLLSIIDNTTTTTEDGKKVGPFVDANGNPMTATELGKQLMIDKLTLSKDEMIQLINDYVKMKDEIDIRSGQLFTDELLEELVWLKGQIKNWQARSKSLVGEINPQLALLLKEFTLKRDVALSLKNLEGSSSKGDISEEYETLSKAHKSLEENIKVLEVLMNLDISPAILANNPKIIEQLKDIVSKSEDITADDKATFNTKIDDIVKLHNATKLYNLKFNEYLKNPSKLKEAHTEILQLALQLLTNLIKNTFKDKLNSATTLLEFRNIINNEENSEAKDLTLLELRDSGNLMLKDHDDVENYNAEVIRTINSSEATPQEKSDAIQLMRALYESALNLDEIANFDSPNITNENAFDESSTSVEESANRFLTALYIAQSAMSKVNNDNRFKDRFSAPYKRPISKPEGFNPSKGTSTDTTGDSSTTTIPSANNSVPPVHVERAIGNVSSLDIQDENKQFNTQQTQSSKTYDALHLGTKLYYRPVIPQLHIEASKEGDFRPFNVVVKERESGVNFDDIYNYLESKGAFDYVNQGKLKAGATIKFAIDPEFEVLVKGKPWHTKPTIFMVDASNNLIVGSLDEGASANNFEGLTALELQVISEYNKQSEDKFFVASPSTKVSLIMVGKIQYGTEERSLKDIPNVLQEGKYPFFGIVKNGTLSTNGKVVDSAIIKPVDMAHKEGRMYLLVLNASGKYSPVAVRVKHFNSLEFNLDDTTVANTPIGKSLLLDIELLANVTNADELTNAVKALSSDLYTGTLHIDFVNTSKGNAIVFKRAILDANGNEIYDEVNGNRVRREETKTVFLTEKWDANTVYSFGEDNQVSTSPESKPIDLIKKEITDILIGFNLSLQVSISQLNSIGYNNRLVNSNILTSNLTNALVVDSWFTTDYFDVNGNPLKANNPASVIPSAKETKTSLVGGNNGAIQGTIVNIPGRATYWVDLTTNTIRNNQGLVQNFGGENQLYFDLAWANENYGNATVGTNMIDNKVITPKGRVLDRTTGKYLSGELAEEVKRKLNSSSLNLLLTSSLEVTPSSSLKVLLTLLLEDIVDSITIDGIKVNIIKEPNMTQGFGKNPSHIASYNYVAVFPNGNKMTIAPNVGLDLETEAIQKVKEALSAKPEKVKEMSGITTTQGAANTTAKELAIQNLDDEFEDDLHLRESQETAPIWDLKKELAWLDTVLPQMSKEDRVKLIKGLIDVANRGTKAWGLFSNGIITLSDIAAEGTTYHEAFHVVFNMLLSDKEREHLFKEARQKFGKDRSNYRLEELMAEDFRWYVMSLDKRDLGTKILDFFKNLFHKVTNWKYAKPTLDNYYRMINQGRYSNLTLGNSSITMNREIEPLITEDRVTTWDTIDNEDRQALQDKGWTKEKYDSISLKEKDQAIKCIAF